MVQQSGDNEEDLSEPIILSEFITCNNSFTSLYIRLDQTRRDCSGQIGDSYIKVSILIARMLFYVWSCKAINLNLLLLAWSSLETEVPVNNQARYLLNDNTLRFDKFLMYGHNALQSSTPSTKILSSYRAFVGCAALHLRL